jgi:hypothetical protein
MPFEDGNKFGRPPGSKNKGTAIKAGIRAFLETKMKPEVLQELYDNLSPKEQKNMIVELLLFVEAKKKEVDIALGEGNNIQFVLAPMVAPTEQLPEPTADHEIVPPTEVEAERIAQNKSKLDDSDSEK